jgi:hypothetical protein
MTRWPPPVRHRGRPGVHLRESSSRSKPEKPPGLLSQGGRFFSAGGSASRPLPPAPRSARPDAVMGLVSGTRLNTQEIERMTPRTGIIQRGELSLHGDAHTGFRPHFVLPPTRAFPNSRDSRSGGRPRRTRRTAAATDSLPPNLFDSPSRHRSGAWDLMGQPPRRTAPRRRYSSAGGKRVRRWLRPCGRTQPTPVEVVHSRQASARRRGRKTGGVYWCHSRRAKCPVISAGDVSPTVVAVPVASRRCQCSAASP